MPVPKYHELYNPVLQALKILGGSGSIAEIRLEVIRFLNLSDEDLAQPHGQRRSYTELDYRLAWARTYLKLAGLIENTERGLWVLTADGRNLETADPQKIKKDVRAAVSQKNDHATGISANPNDELLDEELSGTKQNTHTTERIIANEVQHEELWREELDEQLQLLAPDAFERLCQRILRESGFVEVKVTGRAGDGGIDGVGIVRLGGLLGFPVLFQCKRYKGTVSSSVVRDFRGAMSGRADRGIVITTGTFSRDAISEASRPGAQQIDLLDKELLLDKLKELRLGVSIRLVEEVTVLSEFFRGI